jgi:spore germination protein KA
MDEKFLTSSLQANINLVSSLIPLNPNVVIRELILKEDIKAAVIYIDGITDKAHIDKNVIYPLLFKIDIDLKLREDVVDYISKRYISASNISVSKNLYEISNAIMSGNALVLVEGSNYGIICSSAKGNFRPVEKPDIEKAVRGSKEAFVENLEINVAIIQKNLKNSKLIIEYFTFGTENNSNAALLYVEGIIDEKMLKNIKEKLKSIEECQVLETGYVEQLTDGYKLCPFPIAKNTERPMKVVSDLLQGKAAIAMDNTPFVLVIPAVFVEFFQGVEDYLQNIFTANLVKILRIFGTFMVLILSPVYLVLLSYNSELLPLKLMTTIIASRTEIPLPPFLEILAMEITVEILREGGLRLPSPVGQTLSIVGGIVIGDASIRSGIVSPTTLIVVCFSAIATFLIPNYDMALSIRFLRFPLLFAAQFWGFLGIILGLTFLLMYLIKLETYGLPYLSPLSPMRNKNLNDVLFRGFLADIIKLPVSFRGMKKRRKNNEKN